MKLSLALLAAGINADNDRLFSDGYQNFLNEEADWFSKHDGAHSPKNFMKSLITMTPVVFNEYFGEGSRQADLFNRWFRQIQRGSVFNVRKCRDLDLDIDFSRKRRDDDRTIFQTHELKGNPKQDFWAIMWGHATWIRETMLSEEGRHTCASNHAFRLLQRIDRMRLLVQWQYCDKVDPNYEQCRWVHKYNHNVASQGVQKGDERPNPREWDWFQEDGKYMKDYVNP